MIFLLACAAWICLILLMGCLCAIAQLGDLNQEASESLLLEQSQGIAQDVGRYSDGLTEPAPPGGAAHGGQRRVAA
jgi:hypothetical protein